MAWNFMQTELIPEDMLIRPMIGTGGMDRDTALAEVQDILDRMPTLATAAATWRRGAQDDTVYAGPFVWCVYEHPDGEDPSAAALVWLEDYAQMMRAAGATNVSVARLP